MIVSLIKTTLQQLRTQFIPIRSYELLQGLQLKVALFKMKTLILNNLDQKFKGNKAGKHPFCHLPRVIDLPGICFVQWICSIFIGFNTAFVENLLHGYVILSA